MKKLQIHFVKKQRSKLIHFVKIGCTKSPITEFHIHNFRTFDFFILKISKQINFVIFFFQKKNGKVTDFTNLKIKRKT